MIIWALIGITAIFLLFVLARRLIHQTFGFKVCSVCAAVSLTWMTLLVLKIMGIEISNLLLGILMGESITGVVYLFEKKAKKEGKTYLLWLKIIIILAGTLLVYLILTQGFSLISLLVLLLSAILTVVIYGILKSRKRKMPVPKKHNAFRKEIEKLEERFEHCCD